MKNIKVNVNRGKISSEKILKTKNFNEILKAVKPTPFYKTGWFTGAMASIIVIATIVGINYSNSNKNTANNQTVSTAENEDTPKEITQKSVIKSPVKGYEANYETYNIEGDKNEILNHKTGSQIRIPKNALTKNGNPVSGQITIKYREFHDPVDIWLSGIPMKYDSSGIDGMLESAGMLELLAYQGDELLEMDPKKPIQVEMACLSNETRFNQYKLDDKSGDWTYEGKDSIVKDDIQNDFTFNPEPEWTNKFRKGLTKEKVVLAEIKKEEPIKPSKVNSSKYTFDLSSEAKDFPYLEDFNAVQFEILSGNKVDNSLYTTEWEDAKISELVSGSKYEIKLTANSDKRTLIAKPVFEGKDLVKAMSKYNSKFEKWNNRVIKQEQTIEEIEANYQLKLEKWKKEEKKLAEAQKKDAELRSNGKLQNKFISSFLAVNTTPTRRVLNLSGIGITNLDCMINTKPKSPKGQKIKAKFIDSKTGAVIVPLFVYLIEKGKNLIYTFNKEQYATFKFNPKEKNTLFTLTPEGKLAVFRTPDFSNIPENYEGEKVFKLEVSDKILINKEEVDSFLAGN